MTTAQDTAKDHCLGRECWSCFLIQLTFPWIPNPLPTLCSPHKKGHFKWNLRLGYEPAIFSDLHHLSKAPIKIQLLLLLTGFGSDRQPELQCLFRFHCDFCFCEHYITLRGVIPRPIDHSTQGQGWECRVTYSWVCLFHFTSPILYQLAFVVLQQPIPKLDGLKQHLLAFLRVGNLVWVVSLTRLLGAAIIQSPTYWPLTVIRGWDVNG